MSGAADTKMAAPVVAAPLSARGVRDEPPKTSAEEDLVFLKSVVDATHVNAVTRAVASLKWYVDNTAVVISSLQALAGLASDNVKKQTLIQQKGGITHLVAAMKKHPSDLKVQEEACWALIAICDQHDSNANAVSKPAIPVLMEQLKANEKSIEYVAVAVHAMDIVCAAASGRKEASLKGVAQLVIDLMKKHTTSARIQERGSGVIRHLAVDAVGKRVILEAGGVAFLSGLKKLFPNSSVLDENATEALKRIEAKDKPASGAADAKPAAAAAAPAAVVVTPAVAAAAAPAPATASPAK